MIYNIITVRFGRSNKITASPINYKFDEKQILVIDGLELPEYYEVDFCNLGDDKTITMIGNSEGVQIPDDYLTTGLPIKAYIVIFGQTEGAVETRYEITIPVNERPERTDMQPTPAEQQQIDSIISAINDTLDELEAGVEHVDQIGHDVEANTILAESWAVGGTGTRQGEDEDNAKFYAEAAEQSADKGGWMHFYIDENGHLIYMKTVNVEMDFKLINGHLFVGV